MDLQEGCLSHPDCLQVGMANISSTTLVVSPGTEGFDLLGVEQPEHEILEQPEQHLAMHGRQRTSRDGGGERPRQEAEAALIGKT